MLQTSSTFNFFNKINFVYNYENINISSINCNNTNFFLFFSNKHFDFYNYFNSSFRWKNSINKNLNTTYFYNFFFIQWCHISFKGKSYRIKKFRRLKKFTFNFGYSHWTKLRLNNMWKFYRRHRQKFLICTLLYSNIVLFKLFFPNIRMMNRYTLRGLRLRKQPIKRRFGKISQHVSILH